MSDEFTAQATKEINEELEQNYFTSSYSCQNDEDITNKSSDIEKHLHKIKGLAPMMKQDKVGELASLNDDIDQKNY